MRSRYEWLGHGAAPFKRKTERGRKPTMRLKADYQRPTHVWPFPGHEPLTVKLHRGRAAFGT